MKVLITGVAGFVGRHLVRELRASGHEVCGICLPGEDAGDVPVVQGNASEEAVLGRALDVFVPDSLVHLAGVAAIPRSWQQPVETFDINLMSLVRLGELVRARPHGLKVLVISSAHVLGSAVPAIAADEDTPPNPGSPYAVSKCAAEWIARAFARQYGWPWIVARPANHVGPGQSRDFVLSSLAHQLAAIALGLSRGPVRVGNLDSWRDFTDARDIVRGYRLLLERGRPGAIYHLASEQLYRIADLWEQLCDIAGEHPPVQVDPALWRPAEPPVRLSATRIRHELGWRPEIPIQATLRDIYADAYDRLRRNAGA